MQKGVNMDKTFLMVLNMSFTASFIIIVILFVRLLFRKAPKWFYHILWAIVLIRLTIPFSFESVLSFVPANIQSIPEALIYNQSNEENSKTQNIKNTSNKTITSITDKSNNSNNNTNNDTTTDTANNINIELSSSIIKDDKMYTIQIALLVGEIIWIFGILVIGIHSVVSVLKLYYNLKSSKHISDNIYATDQLKTPFVIGIIKPKIYLPDNLLKEEKSYILKHEQMHIQRGDHIIKLIAFTILCIHWFNPLVWVSFILMSRDIEMSCDEAVLREMGDGIKKSYSSSLLSLSVGSHMIGGTPLAFGEGEVKNRVRNILNYKKPNFWMTMVALVLVILLGMGMLTNQKKEKSIGNPKSDTEIEIMNKENTQNDSTLRETDKIRKDTSESGIEQMVSSKAENIIIKYGDNGITEAEYKPISEAEQKELDHIIFDHMIRSAAWPGIDITTMEEYYYIKKGTSEYGVFILDGTPCMQSLPNGLYSAISEESYKLLQEIMEGKYRDIYNTIMEELKTYPQDYSPEQAEKDGLFIVMHGEVKAGLPLMKDFLNSSWENKKAAITIVQYTVEGDPIFTHIYFNGEAYYAVEDSTRDKFTTNADRYKTMKYPYIKYIINPETDVKFIILTDKYDLDFDMLRDAQIASDMESIHSYQVISYSKNLQK